MFSLTVIITPYNVFDFVLDKSSTSGTVQRFLFTRVWKLLYIKLALDQRR